MAIYYHYCYYCQQTCSCGCGLVATDPAVPAPITVAGLPAAAAAPAWLVTSFKMVAPCGRVFPGYTQPKHNCPIITQTILYYKDIIS